MDVSCARVWLVVSLTTSSGCSTGGTTVDFTGDAANCDAVRLERGSDEPALGFSVAEILAAAEGRFDVPVRWESLCEQPEKASTACDRAAHFLDEWAGGETTVHVDIVSDRAEAEVHYPTEGQAVCGQRMLIPVELRLTSDDGLLDETTQATIWSECGDYASVDVERLIEASGGALAPPSSGLPRNWTLESGITFSGNRIGFSVYVASAAAGAVFTSDLPPFGQGTDGLRRTRVELEQGSPMPGENHCKFAF